MTSSGYAHVSTVASIIIRWNVEASLSGARAGEVKDATDDAACTVRVRCGVDVCRATRQPGVN